VFSVVGEPSALQEATFEAVRTALERIDLRNHHGQHPRIGAVDVIPFIAIPPTSREVAIRTAREFAAGAAYALDLPVYLYELASMDPDGPSLPTVRRRAIEWLRTAVEQGSVHPPDFCPRSVHETGGVSVVGARDFLIAYNVNLNTQDVRIADEVARTIRASNGGHPGIRALGLSVGEHAQVSMNLFDLDAVTIPQAYELVDGQASKRRVTVHSSEIVGLAPRSALVGFSAAEIKLTRQMESCVLEARIEKITRRKH